MKILKSAFFVLGFFVLAGPNQTISAQIKEVSYSEVIKLEQVATGLLRSVPHRVTLTAESLPSRGKEASWKGILVREIVPPDRLREVQETVAQGKSERRELIAVGGKFYQRINNGPWQELPPPPNYIGPTNGPTAVVSKPRIETEARLIESLTDDGRLVSVYEIKSRITKVLEEKEVTQITTSRLWFRDDGMLLKKAVELEVLGDPKIVINTTVYKYGDVKIEAPINP